MGAERNMAASRAPETVSSGGSGPAWPCLPRLKYLAAAILVLLGCLPAGLWYYGTRPERWTLFALIAVSALVLGGTALLVRVGWSQVRALQAMVENAEKALSCSGATTVVLSPDYTIAETNQCAQRLHGQILGRKCHEAFRSLPQPCPECKVPEALAGGSERTVMECMVLDREGKSRCHAVTLRPMRDEAGRITGVSRVAVDIEDRKQLELELSEKSRALQESDTKYKNYLANAADAILITDLESNILESNRQLAELIGLPPEDALHGNLFLSGIIPDAERERVLGIMSRMMADRHWRQYEMELFRRDGKLIEVEVRSIPIFIADRPAGVQYLFRDITLRKREEVETNLLLSISSSIKEAPDLNSLVTHGLSGVCAIMQVPVAALFLLDGETKDLKLAAHQGFDPRTLNDLVVQAVDWSATRVASRSAQLKRTILVSDLSELTLSPATQKAVTTAGVKALFSTPLLVENRLEGAIVLVARDHRAFDDDRQTIIKRVANELALGIARQKLQDVVQNKNKELIEKNREIESATLQLLQSEKMASIGQLAAGVAHEINNPMGYISSNLNVLDEYREDFLKVFTAYERALAGLDPGAGGTALREALAEKERTRPDELFREFAAIIRESQEGTKRVKAIVLDLKNFSHPEAGEAKWFDLHQGLDTTLNIVWNEIKYKAKIVKEYGDLPQIKGYPQELNQVFMNLLVNAAQAIKNQGEITIRTANEGAFIKLTVSDTGVGIPPENLSRIFDPFFTTKEIGKGTGLGLAITYRIIQKHGGHIAVSSRPGEGTTFTIHLPVVAPEIMKEAS